MSFGLRALYSPPAATAFSTNNPVRWSNPNLHKSRIPVWVRSRSIRAKASASEGTNRRFSACTADELHFVSVPGSDWSLALWRYLPSPEVKPRNHPLLLLSGIATNAIGYDLSPECSFARYMSRNGFDTWTLELRGSGLSTLGLDLQQINLPFTLSGHKNSLINNKKYGNFRSRNYHLSETSTLSSKDTSRWLENVLQESQKFVPRQFSGMQENFSSILDDFQQQFELIFKYDWDFDNFLEEDLPAAMEYIRAQCKPDDGKLHAIGHSMGGILLYSRVSQCCSEGKDSGFLSITTLASSLDYSSSRSSLKLLLPLADPAEALNVPAIPVGTILAAIHPFVSHPPYLLYWLKGQVSAQGMMQPELYEKLLLNNFCTIPAKLLLQLASAFYKRGLSNRSGTFFYRDHLHKTDVPVLAIGGDQDRICPPEAVYETAKLVPEDMLTLKILGEPRGPHYAHYDMVGSDLASEQVYPHIIKFLNDHDYSQV